MPDDLRAPLTPAERRKAAEAIIDLRGVETVEGLLRQRDELVGAADRLLAERDRYRDALASIVQWAEAYPLRTFPEPDFARAAAVLSDAGMTLDAISASNMRHAIRGAGDIARAALTEGGNDAEA